MGNNGHWIDGDGSNSAPQTLTMVIEEAVECSTQLTVTARTGSLSNSDTTNTIYLAFKINGVWTTAETFFSSGAAKLCVHPCQQMYVHCAEEKRW